MKNFILCVTGRRINPCDYPFTDEAQTALFIKRPSPYRALKTFHLGNKNQSVYTVSGTSRCLFSDKYKTWL